MVRVPSDKSIYATVKFVGRPKSADGRVHASDCLEFAAAVVRWLPMVAQEYRPEDCDVRKIKPDTEGSNNDLIERLLSSSIQSQILAVAAWDLAKRHEEIHSIRYRPYRIREEPDIDFAEEIAAFNRQEGMQSPWVRYLKRKRQEHALAKDPNWKPKKVTAKPPTPSRRFERYLRRFTAGSSTITKQDTARLQSEIGYEALQQCGFSSDATRPRHKPFKERVRFPPPPRALLDMTKRMLTYWRRKRDFQKAQKLIEKLVRRELSLQHD
jgi:hypothetical protein